MSPIFLRCTANSRGQLAPGEERGAGPAVVGVLAPGAPQNNESAHLASSEGRLHRQHGILVETFTGHAPLLLLIFLLHCKASASEHS
jgi:hypothetical protein